MFAEALLNGLANAALMTWTWTLENPWILLVVAALLALRWLESRQRRSRRRR